MRIANCKKLTGGDGVYAGAGVRAAGGAAPDRAEGIATYAH